MHNGSSQAAPLGTGGEAGLRKAEDGGGRDVESWKEALAFCIFVARTHLSLCSITQTSAPSGLQLSLSALLHLSQVVWQPPGGRFCPRYKWVGWGKAGDETWRGGEDCVPSRRFPGWSGGHPSMSQLKRWCFTSMSCTPSFSGFFSFSCRMTQRPRQCTTP